MRICRITPTYPSDINPGIGLPSYYMTKNITYHDNGNICEEGFYKDGRREGECISYYENGEKELVSYFNVLYEKI